MQVSESNSDILDPALAKLFALTTNLTDILDHLFMHHGSQHAGMPAMIIIIMHFVTAIMLASISHHNSQQPSSSSSPSRLVALAASMLAAMIGTTLELV